MIRHEGIRDERTRDAPAPYAPDAPYAPHADQALLSYAYAVGREGAGLEIAMGPATGMAGAPLRTVVAGGLTAVVCTVPEAEFSEAGLKARLENLDELEVLARSHHSVVEALARETTVLPLRLATVYLDDERVAGMLRGAGPELRALLDRLADHLEWGVKVYVDPAAGPASSADHSHPETPGTDGLAPESAEQPGRAYLRQRRAQRHSRDEAYRTAQEGVRRALAAAAEYAEGRVTHRPQQGELAEGGGDMGGAGGSGQNIANEAFLVPLDRSEAFRAAVEEADRDLPGVRIEVTGPWAPYSFAVPEGEGAGHAG